MVRNVDYETRRRSVLTETINRYILDAMPVSSEDIAHDFDLSSATIRHVFSELEETGYLTHPYTSGGRIPTDKGYRYYVDLLISKLQLLDEEKERIEKEYRREMKRLEEALEEATEILSRITHYAGIVSFLHWHDKFFYKGLSHMLEQPEFRDSQKVRLLIKMIEDKHKVLDIVNRDFTDKVKVYIGKELGYPEIQNCSLVVSSYSVNKRPSGRLAVLGPMRMEYKNIIPTVEYISELLSDVLYSI